MWLREWKELGLAERLQKGPSRVDIDSSPGLPVLWPCDEGADRSHRITLPFPLLVQVH